MEIITAFEFEVLTPASATYQTFHQLIGNSTKTPPDIFDFYLAATLLDNGINQLLTVNIADFAGITSLNARNPFEK